MLCVPELKHLLDTLPTSLTQKPNTLHWSGPVKRGVLDLYLELTKLSATIYFHTQWLMLKSLAGVQH